MGGSCIDVGNAVAGWKQHMEPLKNIKNKMYLGSPAVCNGPQGLPWLAQFINSCTGCNIDFVNIHWFVFFSFVIKFPP